MVRVVLTLLAFLWGLSLLGVRLEVEPLTLFSLPPGGPSLTAGGAAWLEGSPAARNLVGPERPPRAGLRVDFFPPRGELEP